MMLLPGYCCEGSNWSLSAAYVCGVHPNEGDLESRVDNVHADMRTVPPDSSSVEPFLPVAFPYETYRYIDAGLFPNSARMGISPTVTKRP